MAKYLRHRPSPSMVISVIALIVAMGGTGYAALSLPKNSVGTKQIKNNAVTGAKIKNSTVTGSDVKNGSLTGADVNLGALGKVPTATNADHAAAADNATNAGHAGSADSATNATNATNAGNADTVGGVTVKKILFKQATGSGSPTTILDLGGLQIVATCTGTTLALAAKTTVDHAEIHAHPLASPFTYSTPNSDSASNTFTDFQGGTDELENDNFNIASTPLDIADNTNTGTDSMSGLVFYATRAGSVVNVQYMAEEVAQGSDAACLVSGFAMAS